MALTEQAAQQIQDMVWALADDQLPPAETKRLEELLVADPEARQLYVQCMQLQADLHLFFNPNLGKLPTDLIAGQPAKKSVPVMTTLPQASATTGGMKLS